MQNTKIPCDLCFIPQPTLCTDLTNDCGLSQKIYCLHKCSLLLAQMFVSDTNKAGHGLRKLDGK